MCGVQLNDRKRGKDLILMLAFNRTIDELTMTNSVCWHSRVSKMEDGHVLRRATELEAEGKRKKRKERTW